MIARRISPHPWLLVVVVVATLVTSRSADAETKMVRATFDGRTVTGLPMTASSDKFVLLGRDGQIWNVDRRTAKVRKTTSPFSPLEIGAMRELLAREFGRQYEITGTAHYLVVHPQGQRDRWANRFEALYREFVYYFSRRGFTPHRPRFPLVAVVFKDKTEYQRHALADTRTAATNWLGYYSNGSNRIYMYDVGKPHHPWFENATTLIHEATHQTAFNTGIHSRFSPTPRWLTEGLAMMFEARGVWNSRGFTSRRERINVGRLAAFKRYAASKRSAGTLVELIASDRPFSSRSADAYAESWALVFFLVETQPRKFSTYLAKTTSRPAFRLYSSQARMADFTAAMGANLSLLEAQFLRFMSKLK
jgi:hypothetical protein